jgi:hypothetical protein
VPVRAHEPRAAPAAVRGAVDPEQHACAGDAVPAQHVDEGHVRRATARALVTAEEHGEPRLVAGLERRGGGDRDQAGGKQRGGRLGRGADRLGPVDGDRDERQVLRQRQQPVGAEVVLEPEAERPAQQHARA